MEPKKTERADIEKKKGLFLQIGLLTVLILILIAFEWTTREIRTSNIGQIDEVVVEEEIIPITRQEEPPPPPPPSPVESEVFEIVDDDVEIEDEFFIEDAETRRVREDFRIITTEFEEEEEEEGEIFFIVEDMPTFQGQDHEYFRQWIQENMRYPQRAAEAGISGRVIVQFVVEPDGSISSVEVVRGVDRSLDEEAIRVIENSPRWEPGKQRGEPVRVRFTFPINFVLE